MGETLNIQTLIRRFQDKLRRLDDAGMDRPAGNGPRFPMLTVCLGRNADTLRRNLSDRLFRLWPQYRTELRFLRAEPVSSKGPVPGAEPVPSKGPVPGAEPVPSGETVKGSDSTDAAVSCFAEDSTAAAVSCFAEDSTAAAVSCFAEDGTPLDGDGLRAIVSNLFASDTHFTDYDSLLLCVVLDTSGMTDAAELRHMLDAARAVRRETRAETVRELWCVCLDEGHGRERVSEELRRELAKLMERSAPDAPKADGAAAGPAPLPLPPLLSLPPLLLLSNRRSDGRMDADWKDCCSIAADAFAAANSVLGGDLFRDGAYTAAWNRVEKPYGAISQLCVCALLDQFSVSPDLPEEEELRTRLDLSREYTFQLLDKLDRSAYLPQPFQLELFPLPAPRRAEWTNPQTPAREFDQHNFGAWSCWLDRTYEKLREDAPEPARTAWEYAETLRERFSMPELAALGERRDDAARWFRSAKPPSGDLPLLAYAESYWKYRASSEPAVSAALLDVLGQLAAEGRAFVDSWRALEQSRAALYRIGDEDLSRFYRDLLRDCFDSRADALRQTFRALQSREELETFLDRAMDDLLRDPRLRNLASFGDELAARLKTAANSAQAGREVLRNLSGDALPVYFTAKFNLGCPVRAFLLAPASGPLYQDLRAELPEETCFYDTGGGADLEALTLYRVERGQLM